MTREEAKSIAEEILLCNKQAWRLTNALELEKKVAHAYREAGVREVAIWIQEYATGEDDFRKEAERIIDDAATKILASPKLNK